MYAFNNGLCDVINQNKGLAACPSSLSDNASLDMSYSLLISRMGLRPVLHTLPNI